MPSFTFAKSGPLYPAIALLWFSLRGLWDPDVPLRELGIPIMVLTAQAVIFGVASIVFAWILQCVVVIVRTRKPESEKPPA